MYMDDIKLFGKNEKELETLVLAVRMYSQGYRDIIWHRKMRHAYNEKRETTNDGWNRTTKPRKNQNA